MPQGRRRSIYTRAWGCSHWLWRERFATVTAVEASARAAGDLQFNAERAGLAVGVVQSDAEAWMEQLENAPDFVLLDPPRAGIGRRMVARLAQLRPGAGDYCLLRPGDAGA